MFAGLFQVSAVGKVKLRTFHLILDRVMLDVAGHRVTTTATILLTPDGELAAALEIGRTVRITIEPVEP